MTPSELGPMISRIERVAEICMAWQRRRQEMIAVYRFPGMGLWHPLDAAGISAIRARYVGKFRPEYLPYRVFSRACWWLAEHDQRPKLTVKLKREECDIVLSVKTGEKMDVYRERGSSKSVPGMTGVYKAPPGRADGPFYLKRALYGTGIAMDVGCFDSPEEALEYWTACRAKMREEAERMSSTY